MNLANPDEGFELYDLYAEAFTEQGGQEVIGEQRFNKMSSYATKRNKRNKNNSS